MNIRSEIESDLYSIESFLDDIKILEDPEHQGFVSDSPYEALTKFKEFKAQFEKYKPFLDQGSFTPIKQKLEYIKANLITLENRGIRSQEESLVIARNTISAIKALPDLQLEKFNFYPEITIEDVINFLPDIGERNTIIYELDIENNLKKIPKEYEEEGKKLLIDLHNTIFHYPTPNSSLIYNCLRFFQNLKERNESELVKKQEELQETNNKLEQVKAEIGLISTDQLVKAFSIEANSQSQKISTLSSFIFFIFTFLIFFSILLLFLSYKGTCFVFPKSFYFYSFFISFIVICSGLLTYLIKERTRIVNYQNYCNITYLEIIALMEYTAQLNDKVKAEDLKIKLAERYFKGPNLLSNSSETSQDNNLITSKLSEVSKTLSDLKSALNIK
ncbi:hypothetical protein RGJ24_001047 [Acinetobacter baumannii]|nr:hypothetical protein [Acinetobacter baumannii]